MRASILGLILLMSLLPIRSAAQRGAIRAGGGSSMSFSGSYRLPSRGPRVPLESLRTHSRLPNYGYGWGYPAAFDGYDEPSYSDVISIPEQESCGPILIQPPPQPARPEMHEYKWPESNGDTAATFVLLLTDGSVHHAIAVWIQNDDLYYITPEGTEGRLAPNSINREGTRTANAARHLTLSLPAGI